MKNLQDIAALFFIVAVFILSAISIAGVWEIFEKDVISKSFQTLGLLAAVSVVVMVSGKFIDKKSNDSGMSNYPSIPNPIFKPVRHFTIGVLIISASLLALLGVLSIWEVISDKDILYKSIGSLAVLAFAAFVVVLTSLEREGKSINKEGKFFSGGGIILVLILLWLTFSMLRFFF